MNHMQKIGQLNLSTGFIIRVLAGIIIALSLPYLVANPSNPIVQGIFAFGNFLLVIGANVR